MKTTIIIPTHIRDDQERQWFNECLESVRSQTVLCEVIVVENGSQVPVKKVSSVRWITEEIVGLSHARNVGVKACTTEFFFLLDADDLLPLNAIELAEAKYPGDGFLYGSTILFDERGRRLYKARPYDFQSIMQNTYWPNGCLQRTEDCRKVGGWDESLPALEDWDYWLTAGERGVCGHPTQDVLYWYRINPNGIVSSLKRDRALWDGLRQRVTAKHVDIFEGRFPMSCCGGSRAPAKPKMAAAPGAPRSSSLPGSAGMMFVTYTGTDSGGIPRYGPVTGTRYVFNKDRRSGYIDARDARTGDRRRPGLLELTGTDGQPIFHESSLVEVVE